MVSSSHTIAERLSSRLIVVFASVILVTMIVSGALAYWLVRSELEEQAWSRLRAGQRVTVALLAADRRRLNDLVALTAQRPTLQRLLQEGDEIALGTYLSQFQAAPDVDLLAVYDARSRLVAGEPAPATCGVPRGALDATFCLLPGPPDRLLLLGSRPVLDSLAGRHLGYVTLAILVDDAYEERLAVETGVEQSIVLESSRIASSWLPLEPASGSKAMTGGVEVPIVSTGTLNVAGQPYLTTLLPLRDDAGETIALAEIALPISGLKNAERRILLTLSASTLFIAVIASASVVLLRKTISDQAVEHLRSHFLANITHEFRTPLSGLRASVEFLVEEMGSLSREEIEALLHAIHLSVTGLQTLVDNLLESISIEAGHFAIHREPVDLDDVVEDAARVMQPLLNRRRQQLSVSLPPTLPKVVGDPTRLAQVLVNLLANASKYGPMGQTIDLEVCLEDDRLVRVAVADCGPGLSPSMQEKLFHRFSRVSHDDGAQHGVGLGLWIVKAIVTEHGGAVGVEARPGGGAIFWFTLPVAIDQ